ncbi:MAG: hypothetical protein NUV98_01760 [Candidatus Roizmanbacteria bacterium]|nr:hypothetical protein [Candidatus Roizmanbacteria bacterium]
MITSIKPVLAFYDDEQPLLLVLISYRSDTEFTEIFDMSSAVYGTYIDPDKHVAAMLVAMSRSTYEQVHLTAESTKIIDDQFVVSNYFVFEGDIGGIISIPGASEMTVLSDSALLLKTTDGIALPDARPLVQNSMPLPYLAETIDTASVPDDIPSTEPAENRIIVFVISITVIALLVALGFYLLRRKKQDISKYY